MNNITLLGIDLAKDIFQLHGTDERGKVVLEKQIKRAKLSGFIANLPRCTIVMEACSGANYWSRCFQKFGHEVKQISPQFVKPYVKTNKNDIADSAAINEAGSRPHMRFVTPKSIEQQDIQNLHRIRSRLIKQRTALGNQIRGLLAEYGICIGKSLSSLRCKLSLILEDAENELTALTREVVEDLRTEISEVDKRISQYELRIKEIFKSAEACQRIAQIKGIGELTATALIAGVGDAKQFKNGRQFSAYLGLVPRQCSSGGREKLLGISKRGDTYLRCLLIHGARAVLAQVDKKEDKRSGYWSVKKRELGMNKAAVALANKNARVIWALLSKGENYDVEGKKQKAA